MYRHIITFKADVPEDTLKVHIEVACKAFRNRIGTIPGQQFGPNKLVFEAGDDKGLCCLGEGMWDLEHNADFVNLLESWNYEDDDDPGENESVLALIERRA